MSSFSNRGDSFLGKSPPTAPASNLGLFFGAAGVLLGLSWSAAGYVGLLQTMLPLLLAGALAGRRWWSSWKGGSIITTTPSVTWLYMI